jgi:lysine 2,3-aminomutase
MNQQPLESRKGKQKVVDKLATLPREEWRNPDWRWQMSHRLTSVRELQALFPELSLAPEQFEVESRYPFAITPYYLSLIQSPEATDPIVQMAIPQGAELQDAPALFRDPLAEEPNSPVPGLIHRYPDRVVLIMNGLCPVYCRHCTRKRFVGLEVGAASRQQVEGWVEYLKRTPQVKDVILSGGDPLTLSTARLEHVIKAVHAVESVEMIRIGTRIPVLMPMRVDDELVEMLAKYPPIWVVTHFNHPNELSPQAKEACERLLHAGVPVNNQSVLLRGINDHPDIMEALCRGLMRNRVRPYYMHQCDLIQGIEHLRTPISRGLEIMEALRGRLGGLAIPQYVIDLPQGGGKVPLLPNYILSTSPHTTVLRNFEGRIVAYPEPAIHPDDLRLTPSPRPRGGISDRLNRSDMRPLIPQDKREDNT